MKTVSLFILSWIISVNAFASERIVSAGAGVTELIMALDNGQQLVGVDSTSQVPETLPQVSKLGYHRMLSAEGIIALNPSVVIGTPAMGPTNTLAVLKQANIDVITLQDAHNKTQLNQNIAQLGQLLDKPKQAKSLTIKVNQQLNFLASQRAKQTHKPKIMFMLLQPDRPARVGGNNTAADTIINLAGGINAVDFNGYKSVSQEGIIALNPDIILLSQRSQQQAGVKQILATMPLLTHTKAIEHNQVLALPASALIGGLGLSAITAATELNQRFISHN